MYAEFVDVTQPAAWDFLPGSIQFRELYDMATDPWQLHNLYDTASPTVKADLAARLAAVYTCSSTACP